MPVKTEAPSGEDLLRRAERGRVTLDEFLSESSFTDKVFAARWRIIRAFVGARTATGRRATPGYVLGCQDNLMDLALRLRSLMSEGAQNKIFSADDLPSGCRSLKPAQRQYLAGRVRVELYVRVLELMREANELWYMEGEWAIPQSAMDQYLLTVKAAKSSYQNSRPFHGRPNRDRGRMKQLRAAAGTSCGMTR